MDKSKENLIIIKNKFNLFKVVILFIWSFFALAALIFNIAGLISRPQILNEMLGLTLTIFFAFFFSLQLCIWNIYGRVQITFLKKGISIENKNNNFL